MDASRYDIYCEQTTCPSQSYCRNILQPPEKKLAEGGKLRATNVYEDRTNVGWRFPCCP